MKTKQIPNLLVYSVLFAVIFGISLWLLASHPENPTNWILYVGMGVSVLMAMVHLAVYSRGSRRSA